MIDCPKIREDLLLSQEEYNALYPIAMSIYFGYWMWEHACNRIHKEFKCEEADESDNEEYNNHIINHFEKAIIEINANPVHCGDCTKQPCPCIICMMEDYFNDARLIRSRSL